MASVINPPTLNAKNGQPMRAKEFLYRENMPEADLVSRTLTPEESGATFEAGAVDLVYTLPATQRGLVYTFIVKTISTVTGLSISPNAVDKIMGNGFTSVDDKDVINTAATDRVGDLIQLVGDGVDGWYVRDIIGTWAKEG